MTLRECPERYTPLTSACFSWENYILWQHIKEEKDYVSYIMAGATVLVILVIYFYFYRPWQVRWGAADDEVKRSMPGDDVITDPSFKATRVVTVNAPAESIWPWIVQIGCKRAGWYSYDWVDNLGIPSAERIISEFQHIEVGQLIPFSPNGKMGMYVKDFAEPKWILWGDKENYSTWYWGLYPIDSDHTRLVTRVRLHYRWLSPTIIFSLLLDIGDIVMMRKCMLGIKMRAEKLHKDNSI
jgi:hypothetical protein